MCTCTLDNCSVNNFIIWKYKWSLSVVDSVSDTIWYTPDASVVGVLKSLIIFVSEFVIKSAY